MSPTSWKIIAPWYSHANTQAQQHSISLQDFPEIKYTVKIWENKWDLLPKLSLKWAQLIVIVADGFWLLLFWFFFSSGYLCSEEHTCDLQTWICKDHVMSLPSLSSWSECNYEQMGKWHDSTANELPHWAGGQCITLLYFRLLIIRIFFLLVWILHMQTSLNLSHVDGALWTSLTGSVLTGK